VLRSAVVDASPLIFLARTGLLDVLHNAAETVIIPPAVSLEVRAREGQDDEAVSALATMPWLQVGPAVTIPASITTWDLGPGESEVIALAAGAPDATAVIDDRLARACAAAHRVACIGTLGLVLAAKRRGELPTVRPALDALTKAGLYVSRSVLDQILREAGE
jgi:predicted nucleic acid-binding protein